MWHFPYVPGPARRSGCPAPPRRSQPGLALLGAAPVAAVGPARPGPASLCRPRLRQSSLRRKMPRHRRQPCAPRLWLPPSAACILPGLCPTRAEAVGQTPGAVPPSRPSLRISPGAHSCFYPWRPLRCLAGPCCALSPGRSLTHPIRATGSGAFIYLSEQPQRVPQEPAPELPPGLALLWSPPGCTPLAIPPPFLHLQSVSFQRRGGWRWGFEVKSSEFHHSHPGAVFLLPGIRHWQGLEAQCRVSQTATSFPYRKTEFWRFRRFFPHPCPHSSRFCQNPHLPPPFQMGTRVAAVSSCTGMVECLASTGPPLHPSPVDPQVPQHTTHFTPPRRSRQSKTPAYSTRQVNNHTSFSRGEVSSQLPLPVLVLLPLLFLCLIFNFPNPALYPVSCSAFCKCFGILVDTQLQHCPSCLLAVCSHTSWARLTRPP